MPRKRWTKKEESTPALDKFREKRRWQIALRRYVLQKSPSPAYAPYFGLDINNLRKWFEYQFTNGLDWSNFGDKWQFDHIIPVNYFDFTKDIELRLCWNFLNLRVASLQNDEERGSRMDIIGAKSFFQELHVKTSYDRCLQLLEKIERIERSELISSEPQQAFIIEHQDYLTTIETYSAFEFELLNRGRSIEDVRKEIDLLKKYIR